MSRRSPLGAFLGGLAAGFVGSLAQSLFFAATKKAAPRRELAAFEPAEYDQHKEMPTETVARRVVENVMKRSPLVHQSAAGQAVHFAFGASWGAAYGLVAGTLPRHAPLSHGLAFGTAVWLASDGVVLPAFRLSAWPQHYTVKTHLYALAAHLVYGSAVALTFASLERAARPATAKLGAAWITRRLPRFARPHARHLVERGLRVALPVHDALLALR